MKNNNITIEISVNEDTFNSGLDGEKLADEKHQSACHHSPCNLVETSGIPKIDITLYQL